MSYTLIPKPTTYDYTNINTQGREQYDQSTITYDDPSVFYDGSDPNAWTDIDKPLGFLIIRAGTATGLIMSPTYGREAVTDDPWINVNKPTT